MRNKLLYHLTLGAGVFVNVLKIDEKNNTRNMKGSL